MDALLRRRLMIASGGGSPTPPGPVTTIPYIRGGGDGSYIDTGITPDNTTKVIVWARNYQPGAGNLFGSRTSTSSNRFCILTAGAYNTGRIRIDYGNATDTYADDQFANLSHYHKYEYYQGVLKIDDVTIAATGTQPTFSGTYNLYLFGNNNAGILQSLNFPADICACQIYKGGTLVRDFTPVSSPSVGLYDAVSDTVFANAGGGSFTYGTFNQNAYTPLEYISCSSQQYFDSGIYGSYSLGIVAKFMPTSSTPNWYGIMGLFRGSPAQSCSISTGTADTNSDNIRMYFRLGNNTTSTRCFDGSTSNKLTNKSVVFSKSNNVATVYYNNSQIGTSTATGANSSFTSTDLTLYVGATRGYVSTIQDTPFYGRFYYVRFGSQRNFVPAKKNGVAGMYDTYNDVFYPSITSTPFVEGPTI